MEISFPNAAEVIKELRIWWLNLGVHPLIFFLFLLLALLAWKSPALLKVYLEYRTIKLTHDRRNAVIQRKIMEEQKKRRNR